MTAPGAWGCVFGSGYLTLVGRVSSLHVEQEGVLRHALLVVQVSALFVREYSDQPLCICCGKLVQGDGFRYEGCHARYRSCSVHHTVQRFRSVI